MVYILDYDKEKESYLYYENQNTQMARTFLQRNIYLSFSASRKEELGLSPEFIKALNAYSMNNLTPNAGKFRHYPIEIEKWGYRAPDPLKVPGIFERMNGEWNRAWRKKKDPFELVAQITWDLVYLQAFPDGNKRTARMSAYFALNRCFGRPIPGTITVLSQIDENPDEFYDALSFCHETARPTGHPENANLSKLQDLINRYTENQLWSVTPPTDR